MRQVERYLSEMNEIQLKYEKIKDRIRNGNRAIDVPKLKRELIKEISGPSRKELQEAADNGLTISHFLSRADSRYFSGLVKKCNVGENLLSMKGQMEFLATSDKILHALKHPEGKERDELEFETKIKGMLALLFVEKTS